MKIQEKNIRYEEVPITAKTGIKQTAYYSYGVRSVDGKEKIIDCISSKQNYIPTEENKKLIKKQLFSSVIKKMQKK